MKLKSKLSLSKSYKNKQYGEIVLSNHLSITWIHYLKSKNIFSIYSGIIFIGGTILNISVKFIVGIIWVHFWEIKNRFFFASSKVFIHINYKVSNNIAFL